MSAAGRYAKSLLELAKEQDVLDVVHDDMVAFSKACEDTRELKLVLENPIVNHSKKLEILNSIFGGKVNELTMAIFNMITRKNRESILYSISKEFHIQYNAFKGIGQATIVSSTTLDKKQLADVEALIASSTGKKVELEESVDEELIGGFVLTVEGNQFDTSVKTQLRKLNNIFSDNPYISKL